MDNCNYSVWMDLVLMKRAKWLCFFASVLFVVMFSVFAQAKTENTKLLSNQEFGVAVAELVKSYNTNQIFSLQSTEPETLLGIIGKTDGELQNLPVDSNSNVLLCKDNRFFISYEDEATLKNDLEKLKKNEHIVYVNRDSTLYTCEESVEKTESIEHLSWGTEALGCDEYIEYLSSLNRTEETIVAIIDSGASNIDFLSDRLIQGYDFVDNDSDPSNDTHPNSHGTFLASIVVDCTVSLPIKIMPVRVLQSYSGSLSNIINGIYFAVDAGVDVINISLGGKLSDCQAVDDAINYANINNVVVVVCAGNEKDDVQLYCPAHNESVITVSATNKKNEFASYFSNFGSTIDVAAPGTEILGYNAKGVLKSDTGTSMSTAFISACVAMIKLEYPMANAKQVQDLLVSSTEDYGAEGWDEYYGWGLPNLKKMVGLNRVLVTKLEMDSYYELNEGDSCLIMYSVLPSNADVKDLVWRSSDESIATVDNGRVTAIAPGQVAIIAETVDGGFIETCEIVIYPRYADCLSIMSLPNKTEYYYGEDLSLEGVVLEAKYPDGSFQEIELSSCKVSGYNSKQVGSQKVFIEYGSSSVYFNVNVKYNWWQWFIVIALFGWIWY